MAVQTKTLNWSRTGDQRTVAVDFFYKVANDDGAARQICDTTISITFKQEHSDGDTPNEVISSIKGFCATMLEEAALEIDPA